MSTWCSTGAATRRCSRADVRDRVVRIGSAGKTFSVTGWKVGYVTADAKLIAPIARAHQFVTFTTPPALQSAVAFGLRLPDSYYDGLRSALETRRDVLVEGLRAIGFHVGDVDATYFAVASASRFDDSGDDAEFCRRLTLQAGVTAVPISAFYGDRDVKSHVRFCFAKQRETLESALERLSRWSRRAGLRAAS